MAKFFETRAFKELKNVWDEKLKQSGFVDFEKNEKLKQNSANSYRQANQLLREAKLEYFRLITYKAHEDEHISPIDLTVMTLRGDGIPIQTIAEEIQIHRQTVRYIIRRYEHAWGIKFWSSKQRNLKHG